MLGPRQALQTGLARFGGAGGWLWAIAMGFVTLFVGLPTLVLVAFGVGEAGLIGLNGLINTWASPVFVGWMNQIIRWCSALVSEAPNGSYSLRIEGWYLVIAGLAVWSGLARQGIEAIWRPDGDRLTNWSLRALFWALTAVALVAVPLGTGYALNAANGAASASVAAVVFASAFASSCVVISAAGSTPSLNVGASVRLTALTAFSSLLVVTLFALVQQWMWLGPLAGLPMVGMAVLASLFSIGWALFYMGGFVAQAFEPVQQPVEELDAYNPAQILGLGLDVLHELKDGTPTRRDVLPLRLGITTLLVDQSLNRLMRHGLVDPVTDTRVVLQADLATTTIRDVAVALNSHFDPSLHMSGEAFRRQQGAEAAFIALATSQQGVLALDLASLFDEAAPHASFNDTFTALIPGYAEIVEEEAAAATATQTDDVDAAEKDYFNVEAEFSDYQDSLDRVEPTLEDSFARIFDDEPQLDPLDALEPLIGDFAEDDQAAGDSSLERQKKSDGQAEDEVFRDFINLKSA